MMAGQKWPRAGSDEQQKFSMQNEIWRERMHEVFGNPTVSITEGGEMIGWAVIEDGYLSHIGVLEDKRRTGTGTKVLQLVFDHMKKTKTRTLRFVNIHPDFWAAMKTKFPRNIKLTHGKELLVIS